MLRPEERREAVLRVIRAAEKRLVISLFRCDDFEVLDALAGALSRRVRVQALLTRRAKGWRKRLDELGTFLEGMGAEVRRYAGPRRKYHAKYLVADDGQALITSLNFTRKCFGRTCDFLLTCDDANIVAGLKTLFDADWRARRASVPPTDLSDRLIVGPEAARTRLTALIRQARHSIRIIDPKVSDPAIVDLLQARRAAGVAVQVLGRGDIQGLRAHGKLMLVDDDTAVIGSISLSTQSLDARRELAVVVRDPALVTELRNFFQAAARHSWSTASAFAADAAA